MSNIKIELDDQQYKALLKLLYLGEWMAQSHSEESDPLIDAVEQKVYGAGSKTAAKDWIGYKADLDVFYPSEKMESEMFELVDNYDDYTFWDELVDRLGERDFIKEYGEDAVSKMEIEDRIKKEDPFLEKYEEEFNKKGIENLVLDPETE